MMDISLTILKHDNNANEISHVETCDFVIAPNIQVDLTLQPGNYIILPRTTGCLFGKPYDKVNQNINPIYNKSEDKFNQIFISTIKDIFKKFDMLLYRELKYNEFKGFWECVTGGTLSSDEFKHNILDRYNSSADGLTEKGFIGFFQDMYLNKGEVNKN